MRTLLKSIEQAKSRDNLLLGISIGVSNRTECKRYARELQSYFNAVERMKIECAAAYGKTSNTIAIEAMMAQQATNQEKIFTKNLILVFEILRLAANKSYF